MVDLDAMAAALPDAWAFELGELTRGKAHKLDARKGRCHRDGRGLFVDYAATIGGKEARFVQRLAGAMCTDVERVLSLFWLSVEREARAMALGAIHPAVFAAQLVARHAGVDPGLIADATNAGHEGMAWRHCVSAWGGHLHAEDVGRVSAIHGAAAMRRP